MSAALILAAARELLSWELDGHSGCNAAGAALLEALKRLDPYGRNDLVDRLLSAVVATARDERLRDDALAALDLVREARRLDSDAATRRPGSDDGESRRRGAAGE